MVNGLNTGWGRSLLLRIASSTTFFPSVVSMNPDGFSMDWHNQMSNQGFPVFQGFAIPHEAAGRTPSRQDMRLEHRVKFPVWLVT